MPGRTAAPLRRHLPGRLALLAWISILSGCNTSTNNHTTIVNGLDCGLVHNDLIGNWQVTISAGTPTLRNCTGSGSSGGSVTSSGSPMTYTNVTVLADTTASVPLGGVGYQVIGAGLNRTDELIANVEADSCLAQFQVWENADKTYIQCIGTLDRTTRAIAAAGCDSAEFDSNNDGTIDTFCELSATLSGSVQIL